MTRHDLDDAAAPLGANYWRLWWASLISNFGDGLSIIAYPWLASALTRNPAVIAGVLVASRLPWLLITLPAGVVTDRLDRRRLIVITDTIRFLLTLLVAATVLISSSSLQDPTDLADGSATTPAGAWLAIGTLYLAAFLLGCAEVFRDNSAQTLMPSLVRPAQLERANGRLGGIEMIMNSFVGPPAAGLLLAVSFSLPFFVDAATFGVAAVLLTTLRGSFTPGPGAGAASHRVDADGAGQPGAVDAFRRELAEGFAWLWRHPFLRSLAIALGALNGLFAMTEAVQVLFVQEVLGLGALGFGAIGAAAALGGVAGSFAAPRVSAVLGQSRALLTTVAAGIVGPALIAAFPTLPVVVAIFFGLSFTAVVWNVITIALRQTLIPDELLGRVNSVYRFFGWGMIPIGALAGGLLVATFEQFVERPIALRLPFAISAAAHLLLLLYARPRLSSERIEQAKASGTTNLSDR
ncbi:MAG: MFS transporter [Acidimicrobiales bacterium]